MTAQDYKINLPYGATSSPYSPSSPHRGDDRPCPTGTEVVAGGQVIGLTGWSGAVVPKNPAGAHLHIQESYVGDYSHTRMPQNSFKSGKVVNIDPSGTQGDGSFGKFISIQNADGWIDTYCHLSQINVKVGQTIGGELTMTPEVKAMFDQIIAQNNDLKNWILGVYEQNDYIQKQNVDLKNWELDTNKAAHDDSEKAK